MPPLQPGDRVGRYEIVSLLGRGGMGEVWEAVLHGPAGFRKRVALKLIPPRADTEAQRASLMREARLGALLSHPNVVSTLDLDHDGSSDAWVVAMELVRGPTLSALVRSRSLTAGGLLDAAVQACAGLAHIHELAVDGVPAGLVHRDIKPSNLLIDRSGLLKIADLGIAVLASSASQPSGTPGYMAPEVLEGIAEPRTDLFALGAVLLSIVQGRRPFGGGRGALLAVGQVERRLADGAFLAGLDDLVPGLAGVVYGALRADPEDRWPSAAEMGAALRRLTPTVPTGQSLAGLVAGPGDVASTPTHAPPAESHGALPTPTDRFFGRTEARAHVAELLGRGQRLVTLTGPGGMGKTRLSLEVARAVAPGRPGGVWFTELASAGDLVSVVSAIAGALGVPAQGSDLSERVLRALAARGPALVVLDNLEQVVAPLGPWLARCLEAAPEIAVLATSRVPLRIRAERAVQLEPMSPRAAVALFLDRTPRTLEPGEEAEVPSLVDALDGLPLAIELAAARTRLLTPQAILQRLNDRFRLLRAEETDRPERHRSLEASIDGSWEICSEAERLALCQLSTLRAPASLATAEAILDLDRIRDAWTLDVLEGLVAHGLIRRVRKRLVLPGAIRAFATERTDTTVRRAAEARHGVRFAQLGSRDALASLFRSGGTSRLARLSRVLPDLVAGCQRAVDRGDAVVAVATALAAVSGFNFQGPLTEGVVWLERVLGAGLAGAREVELQVALARTLDRAGEPERAIEVADQALQRARQGTDPWDLGMALLTRSAINLATLDPPGAERMAVEAVEQLERSGDRDHLMQAKMELGVQVAIHGRPQEGLTWLDEALAWMERAGSRYDRARAETNRGIALHQAGRVAEATESLQRAVAFHRQLGRSRSAAIAEANLGMMLGSVGRADEGRRVLESSLAGHRAMGDAHGVAMCEGLLGIAHFRMQDLDCARLHLERAIALFDELGNEQEASRARHNLARLELECGHPGRALLGLEEVLAAARRTGHRRSEAITLTGLGRTLRVLERYDEAREHLEAALRLNAEVGHQRGVADTEIEWIEISLALADFDDAVARSERVVDLLDATRSPTLAAKGRSAHARVLRLAGDHGGARRWLEAAIRSLEGSGSVVPLVRALGELAGLVRDSDPVAAARALARARQLLDAEPDGPTVRLAREELGAWADRGESGPA